MIELSELKRIKALEEFRTKLLELNANEENSFIEVKEVSEQGIAYINTLEFRRNEILKAICAFANVAGGMVIIGPNDKEYWKKLKKDVSVLAIPKIDKIHKKIQSIWKDRIRPKVPGIDSHVIRNQKGEGCIVIFVPPSNFLHAAQLKLLNPGTKEPKSYMVYMMRIADQTHTIPPELLPGFIKQRGIPEIRAKYEIIPQHGNWKIFSLIIGNIGNVPLLNLQATLSCENWENNFDVTREEPQKHAVRSYLQDSLLNSGDIPFLKVIASKGISRYYAQPGYVVLANLPQILVSFSYRNSFSGQLKIYGENMKPFTYNFVV